VSLKRQLLTTPDAEPVIPTKRHKGCIPSVTRSLNCSSSKAARQQLPLPAPEGEMVEVRNVVALQRLTQQHSIKTSEVDKDRTQAQSCIKSTMPVLLGRSLSAHDVHLQDICHTVTSISPSPFVLITSSELWLITDTRNRMKQSRNGHISWLLLIRVDPIKPFRTLPSSLRQFRLITYQMLRWAIVL
jgi:hypothetical protein